MRTALFALLLAASSPAAASGPAALPHAEAARAAVPAPRAVAARPAARPPPAEPPAASWGEPDMGKIRRLFKERFPEVKRCYEGALQKDAAARGKFTLRFTIAEGGTLRSVKTVRSTFARPDVPSCVADVVRRWKTPFRPAQPVEVEFPLAFSPR
jgi:hypothetical protein